MYVGMCRMVSAIALAVVCVPSSAAARSPVPTAPHELPAAGARAAAAASDGWLVGARPAARTAALARAHGATRLDGAGAHAVPARRARAFAAALEREDLLRYSEPDRRMRRAQAVPAAPEDETASTDWRRFLLPAPAPAPPPVGADAPLIALVDSQADATHPEFAGASLALADPDRPVIDLHGTATAAVAGAPANGVGILGFWPGARLLNVGTGNVQGLTCGESVRGIATAVRAEARVLNLSFGSFSPCYAQYEAVSEAVARGVLVVAAAGNDRQTQVEDGTSNPVTYPAAFPHVLSVAAFGPQGGTSAFSTANGAVDLAAPGESVVAAVPPAFDGDDGAVDGYTRLDGTSFAAPIVAGAGAWLAAARPDLRADQIAAVLRRSARDLDERGWDQLSGFGAVNFAAALGAPAPARDRSEVNDDVEWVDGRRYAAPDPYVWRGGRAATLDATADGWKDPADVYRVRLPAGRRVRVTLTPPPGADVDLAVFDRSARTIGSRRGRLGLAVRGAGATDRITLRARRRATTAYVAVVAPRSRTAREPGVAYRLRISR